MKGHGVPKFPSTDFLTFLFRLILFMLFYGPRYLPSFVISLSISLTPFSPRHGNEIVRAPLRMVQSTLPVITVACRTVQAREVQVYCHYV